MKFSHEKKRPKLKLLLLLLDESFSKSTVSEDFIDIVFMSLYSVFS